jgi:hypothetical protein
MPTGREIIENAALLLGDEDHVRWTLPELCRWINAGVKATILAKPSAKSETRAITLVEGTKQAVPTSPAPTPLNLLSITCNLITATPRVAGRAIRATTRAQLDGAEPGWRDTRTVRFRKEVRQFIFDENVPLEFEVYPGNDGTGIVEAALSILPTPLAASGDVDDIASYAADIGLPEPYSEPIFDYVVYRAQSKDATSGDAGRAAAHYAQFANAVGLKIQVEGASSPNRR